MTQIFFALLLENKQTLFIKCSIILTTGILLFRYFSIFFFNVSQRFLTNSSFLKLFKTSKNILGCAKRRTTKDRTRDFSDWATIDLFRELQLLIER